MVLSKKKLKQKIRDSKAQLIMAIKAQSMFVVKDLENLKDGYSKTTDSLKTLSNQNPQGSKISKREKRRQKVIQDNSEITNVEENTGEELNPNEVSVNKKKRKRHETNSLDPVESKEKSKIRIKPKKNEAGSMQILDGKNKSSSTESVDRKELDPPTKVYVGGIPYYSTEDDIRSYFEHCGSITNIDCMRFQDSGKFRGIAIIAFKIEAAAKRALTLNGSEMGGFFLKIQPFKSGKAANKSPNFSPSVMEGYHRIYVGNLAWNITEADLRKQFSDCEITSIRFGKDKETGEFKGYAHMDFADELSFSMALKLNQTILCGRPIKISCAVPKKGVNFEPKKKMSEDEGTYRSDKVDSGVGKDEESSKEVNNSVAVSSKVRRRTCYECGEKGHLSSSCPKKPAATSIL